MHRPALQRRFSGRGALSPRLLREAHPTCRRPGAPHPRLARSLRREAARVRRAEAGVLRAGGVQPLPERAARQHSPHDERAAAELSCARVRNGDVHAVQARGARGGAPPVRQRRGRRRCPEAWGAGGVGEVSWVRDADRAQPGVLPHDVPVQHGVLLPVQEAVEDVRLPSVGGESIEWRWRGDD